jgi:hypothetical protein
MGFLLMCATTYSCSSIRYDIKGRVIDEETQKPVEGAAIMLHYYHHLLLPRLTGLSSGYEAIATYESQTDADGYFEITKHLGGDCKMSVYKKGYIGWNSEVIFTPDDPDRFESGIEREDSAYIGYWMEVDLKPNTYTDEDTRYKHANFIDHIADGKCHKFREATESERMFIYEKIRKDMKNRKDRKDRKIKN